MLNINPHIIVRVFSYIHAGCFTLLNYLKYFLLLFLHNKCVGYIS